MMIKLENTKSLTRFDLRSCIVGSTANEFIIIAFCYERAGLVAVNIVVPINFNSDADSFVNGVAEFNSFKPCVPFMANRIAPDVTPQNAAPHLGLFCLLSEF